MSTPGRSRFIGSERAGLWTMVALGTALIALLLSAYNLQQIKVMAAINLAEVVVLKKELQQLRAAHSGSAAAPASSAAK